MIIFEEQKLKQLAESKQTTEKDKQILETNYLDIQSENQKRAKSSSWSERPDGELAQKL